MKRMLLFMFLVGLTLGVVPKAFAHELFMIDHSAYLDPSGKVTISAKLVRVDRASQLKKVRFYQLREVFDGSQLIKKLVPVDITLSLNRKATRTICTENYEICLKERYYSGRRLIRALW